MPKRKSILKGSSHTHLSVDEERAFRHDLATMAKSLGRRLNPADPAYDYRGAWKTGMRRVEDLALGADGRRMWPTEFATKVGMRAQRWPW
jgi:hypothetical protein